MSIEAPSALKNFGMVLKIFTADNHTWSQLRSVTRRVDEYKNLHGSDLRKLGDGALLKRVVDVEVFAELKPIF